MRTTGDYEWMEGTRKNFRRKKVITEGGRDGLYEYLRRVGRYERKEIHPYCLGR